MKTISQEYNLGHRDILLDSSNGDESLGTRRLAQNYIRAKLGGQTFLALGMPGYSALNGRTGRFGISHIRSPNSFQTRPQPTPPANPVPSYKQNLGSDIYTGPHARIGFFTHIWPQHWPRIYLFGHRPTCNCRPLVPLSNHYIGWPYRFSVWAGMQGQGILHEGT